MDIQPRQRPVARFALIFAALCCLTWPSAVQAAPFSEGFGARPATPEGESVAPSYFVVKARPGQTLTETVIVSNAAQEPVEFLLDPVDGLTGTTSGSVYANRDDPQRETSRWLSLPAEKMTLPAQRERELRFTITVPEDARAGDHLAGLAFQDVEQQTSESNFSVRQVTRVVVGVQVKVGRGTPAQAALGAARIEALPGTESPSITMRLANRGQRLCKPQISVAIQGPGIDRTIERQLDTVLPGDVIDYPFPLDGALAAGTFQTLTKVERCGDPVEQSDTLTLADDLSGVVNAPAGSLARDGDGGLPVIAIVAIALAGALGGGALVAFLVLRRRPGRRVP